MLVGCFLQNARDVVITSFDEILLPSSMVLQRIRSALDRLSVKALLQRFDERQLQSHIDTHKLYLLTRLHADRLSGRALRASLVLRTRNGRGVQARI